MAIDWNTKESYQRLLAAVYAASPQNHNYRRIASMFGQGATYDAIEGRFRKIKAEGDKLRREVENGERPEAPPRGAGSANSTPKKRRASGNDSQGVLNGRVTKAGKAKAGKSPKGKKSAVETETSEESFGVVDWERAGNGSQEYGEEGEEQEEE